MTEREIQRESVSAMRKLGYTVWVTSTYRSARNTVGTPDVIVSIARRGAGLPGVSLALEFKAPRGKLTTEQAAENRDESIEIVRSVDHCINYVTAMRNWLEKLAAP